MLVEISFMENQLKQNVSLWIECSFLQMLSRYVNFLQFSAIAVPAGKLYGILFLFAVSSSYLLMAHPCIILSIKSEY